MQKTVVLIAVVLAFMIGAVNAQGEFNPKSVESITMRVVQRGELDVSGDIQKANLSLYIPQEGLQDIKVTSNSQMSWKYASDAIGNKVILLEWTDPAGVVTYRIESTVKNYAKFVNPTSDIGYDPRYLNATKSIVINDRIRQLAYPYDKTWENVAYMTELVYDTVKYDISMVGQRQPSDWVLENKKGVCVEHANLLTALLRASGIPTRYAVGYAYSTVDQKLIGHTWVEVLASDGTWVPFDPTWLQGGFLDATHIKTANLLDDNQIDVLSYLGTGKITWKRGSASGDGDNIADLYADSVDILDYDVTNITSISLMAPDVTLGQYGYVKATINPSACLINQIKIQSCIGQDKNEIFQLLDKERKFFSCAPKDVYWFYKENDGKQNYICPVTVYDQIGSTESVDVSTTSGGEKNTVSIAGPDVTEVGEKFALKASAGTDFIFYSPDFGRSRDDDWQLQIRRPGSYKFYLFENGALAQKTVSVVTKKEFNISVASVPRINLTDNFTFVITVKNLGNQKTAVMNIEFDDFSQRKTLIFKSGETKITTLNFTAKSVGTKQLLISLEADTITPYSTSITIEEKKVPGLLDGIFDAIRNFLSGIKSFFAGIFGGN